ncbi:LuxR C-terminal-related transcriptional regulator [Kitasatospora sp. McL0602]|uniref:helix-turn-helix transcriptional regulator n=1 Tax=Kitasatospora sp. McL0602 TaxID=3439530 RepID=UPI003F8A5345
MQVNANRQESDISGGSLRDIANALADLSRRVDHAAELEAAPPLPAAGAAAPAQPREEARGEFQGDGQIPSVRHLQGLPEINNEIKKALDTVRFEVLTAQPDGPRPGPVLADALEAVRALLDRQVSMRTLYQHSTRFDEATKDYVRAVTRLGAQVRTLPEFFDRVIIIDRATAFIPANEDKTRATKVTDLAVVRFLADTFDRAWDRAARFPFYPTSATQAAMEVMPAVRLAICKLLVEGRSDREIARRLGLSQRSLQSHVARLKEEFGAQHRFQLGYMMACSGDQRRDMAGFDDLADLNTPVRAC